LDTSEELSLGLSAIEKGVFNSLKKARCSWTKLRIYLPKANSIEDLPSALVSSARPDRTFSIRPGMSLAQVEAELIRQTLANVTSNRAEAAKKLGISRRALQYKIKRYGLGTLAKRAGR
jgi:DNA-binding NtrC family response regulator